jgi:hypothetical protein
MNESEIEAMKTVVRIAGIAVLCFVYRPLPAQDSTVSLHGYGFWGFGYSNDNNYSVARKGGEYDNAGLALKTAASLSPSLTVQGQFELLEVDEKLSVELDHVFGELELHDRLVLLVGAVPLPFGHYTESFDDGTSRPFFILPQSIYGPSGFVSESYKGAGMKGQAGSGWTVFYDLYVGELVGKKREFFQQLPGLIDTMAGNSDLVGLGDLFGGRVRIGAPVEGLSVGASSYTGQSESVGRVTAIGGQIEFADGPWLFRGEYLHVDDGDLRTVNGYYAEAAFLLGSDWQLAARLDRTQSDLKEAAESPSSLFRHREAAVGLNYRFNPRFVVKCSYHHVRGNQYAVPKLFEQGKTTIGLEKQTHVVVLGTQFAF